MKRCAFLAGATGAIGRPLARQLVAAGWRVVGTTRRPDRAPALRALGVEPVVVDALEGPALEAAVLAARPEAVLHQLTDLPPGLDPALLPAALARNAHLREVGTRHLVAAAVAAGARRLVAQSIAFLYAGGPGPFAEDAPLVAADDPRRGTTAAGVRCLERQVLEAPLEGVVLRYGGLYGPGTGFDRPEGPGGVQVEAAARGALLALDGPPGVYNLAEPGGPAATGKAQRLLGWDPAWRP